MVTVCEELALCSLATHPSGEQFDTIHEREVSKRDKGTENSRREKDNDRRVAKFGFGRPRGFLELGQRLLVKKTNTCEWIFHL